jgi:hypothetical protein
MKEDANIPEDDWKRRWKPGTYDYLDPEYKPGTHEIERGDVTWHQLRAPEDPPGRCHRARSGRRDRKAQSN